MLHAFYFSNAKANIACIKDYTLNMTEGLMLLDIVAQ
jgi:hypothetical protein